MERTSQPEDQPPLHPKAARSWRDLASTEIRAPDRYQFLGRSPSPRVFQLPAYRRSHLRMFRRQLQTRTALGWARPVGPIVLVANRLGQFPRTQGEGRRGPRVSEHGNKSKRFPNEMERQLVLNLPIDETVILACHSSASSSVER